MTFTRITVNARQMGGVPCIRGLRIPMATVVGMVADGIATDEILSAYPDLRAEDLRAEDIREALRLCGKSSTEIRTTAAVPPVSARTMNKRRYRNMHRYQTTNVPGIFCGEDHEDPAAAPRIRSSETSHQP